MDDKYYLLDNKGNLIFPHYHKWTTKDSELKKLTGGKTLLIEKYNNFPSKPPKTYSIGNKIEVSLKILNASNNNLLFVLKGTIKEINELFIHFINNSHTLSTSKRKESFINLFNLCWNIPETKRLDDLRLRISNHFQYLTNNDLTNVNNKIRVICKFLRINKNFYRTNNKIFEKLQYDCDTILISKNYISNNRLLNDWKLLRNKQFISGFNHQRLLRSLNDVRLSTLDIVPITFDDKWSTPFVLIPPMNKVRLVKKEKEFTFKIEFIPKPTSFTINTSNRVSIIINDKGISLSNTTLKTSLTENDYDRLIDDSSKIKVKTFVEHKKEFEDAIKSIWKNSKSKKPNIDKLWKTLTDVDEKRDSEKIVNVFKLVDNFVNTPNLDIIVDIFLKFNNRKMLKETVIL